MDLPKVTQQHVAELGSELGPSEVVPSCGLWTFCLHCCQWALSTQDCSEQ